MPVSGDAPFLIECIGIEKSFPSPAGTPAHGRARAAEDKDVRKAAPAHGRARAAEGRDVRKAAPAHGRARAAEGRDIRKAAPALSVLRGINLRVREGESLAVVGPSGAGKSTLLSVMGTLEPPSAGLVMIRGRDVSRLSPPRLAHLRNREIGFVFQRHFLLPQLSLLENVLVPAMAAPGGTNRARSRAIELLERVGLGARLSHRPSELSGGECQRAACARALINAPAILLADEPTGSLDSVSADELSLLMVELNRETGVTLVVVTHSDALASRMSRTVRILDGRLQEDEG